LKVDTNLIKYSFVVIIFWSIVVTASLLWNIKEQREVTDNLAKKDAIANFNKDQAFRLWASNHGGVYVPKNDRTPANINLAHIEERDITTSSGKELTLMNPAYMLRQMMDEFPNEYGVKGRIVSDKPLWQPNAPDEWESKAIESFKQRAKEKFEFTTHKGKPYLRLMKPMFVTDSCLKCHAHQGYNVGDVRGGVGVMVDMKPYLEHFYQIRTNLIISYSIVYFVGLILIIIGAWNINRYLLRLQEAYDIVQKSRDNLEIKVEERTDELQKANIKLKELDTLKSMFIASMSHELRTPLNSIIGFTGVLLQGMSGELNERQKDQLTRVKKSGQHLLSLVSDVIDISKIEAGRVEASIEEFSLKEVLKDVGDEIEVVAKPVGLTVEIDIKEDIIMETDKRRVSQCLLNYLSNAVKFTQKSGKIFIKVENIDNDVKISVIDNGIGISKEDQSKLFEAFERLDTHLKVQAGGTGLGLYLTKKITENILCGTVWMESKEGLGSIFGLTIPKRIKG
jgi:signal transduction histidine kinase